MPRINAVIFDLDNVLYDEKDYSYAAFNSIAGFLSKRCSLSQEQIYAKIVNGFQKKTSMYPMLFNDLISDLGLDQNLIDEVLKLFSTATPNLKPFPQSEELLQKLKEQNIKLGLVTNGNVTTQRNKIHLLKIKKYFDVIVYARELGTGCDKPNPQSYEVALKVLGVKPQEAICVGDNPYTDFLGAKKLGIKTVRLQNGEFKNIRLSDEYEADVAVQTLDEAYRLIVNQNGGPADLPLNHVSSYKSELQ